MGACEGCGHARQLQRTLAGNGSDDDGDGRRGFGFGGTGDQKVQLCCCPSLFSLSHTSSSAARLYSARPRPRHGAVVCVCGGCGWMLGTEGRARASPQCICEKDHGQPSATFLCPLVTCLSGSRARQIPGPSAPPDAVSPASLCSNGILRMYYVGIFLHAHTAHTYLHGTTATPALLLRTVPCQGDVVDMTPAVNGPPQRPNTWQSKSKKNEMINSRPPNPAQSCARLRVCMGTSAHALGAHLSFASSDLTAPCVTSLAIMHHSPPLVQKHLCTPSTPSPPAR